MKVSVPRPQKRKYPKDLTRDVSTTMDFGFMQPLLCREIMADATCTLQIPQILRLNPMPKPTFGHVSLNTYTFFVPMETIFHPWGSFLGQQTYRGSSRRYIPDQVITTSCGFLFSVLKACSIKHAYAIYRDQQATTGVDWNGSTRLSWLHRDRVSTSTTANSVYNSWYDKLATNFVGVDSQSFDQVIYPMVLGDNISKTTIQLANQSDLLPLKYYDWYDYVKVDNMSYLVCGKFTNMCRNLRKIFIGCGYKLNNSTKPLSFLPLMAYYKAYFDTFTPQRDITWKDTACAGLQEWCEQNGRFSYTYLLDQQVPSDLLGRFLLDLSKTYYTQNPDYVSAHITGQRITTNVGDSRQYMDTTGNMALVYSEDGQAHLDDTTPEMISQTGLNLLKSVTARLNIKNAFGGKLKEALRSIFNSDYLEDDERLYINSQKLDVFVEPVFSSAETSEAYLGEYAAKGEGKSDFQESRTSFHAKTSGFLVVMAGVIPEARYCQNVDPMLNHVEREDFHDYAFDSLTLLPTAKMFVYGENELGYVEKPDTSLNDGFGNIPNYMEYNVSMNITNGDMSLPSTRDSYLPFNLDKLLPYTQSEEGDISENTSGSLTNLSPDVLVNGTLWRFIGLNRWLGNFDRIFINAGNDSYLDSFYSGRTGENDPFKDEFDDDNFIMHSKVILKVQDYKLPVQDSFMTDVFDGMTVEKA